MARKCHRYTLEEDNFLIKHRESVSCKELSKMFYNEFGVTLSKDAVMIRCRKIAGIKKTYTGFKTGAENTSRKYANPIGTEKWSGQFVYVKIADEPELESPNIDYSVNWEKKHILVYEKVYGKIPPKHAIIFLDQNRQNCDIDNLYCISYGLRAVMSKNRWYSTDPMVTLTAIKYCELLFALKENKLEKETR